MPEKHTIQAPCWKFYAFHAITITMHCKSNIAKLGKSYLGNKSNNEQF